MKAIEKWLALSEDTREVHIVASTEDSGLTFTAGLIVGGADEDPYILGTESESVPAALESLETALVAEAASIMSAEARDDDS